jgi:hypothetical protein
LEKPSAALGFNPGRLDKDLRFLAPETLPDSLLPYIFRARTWTGRGGGGAIRKSTGWDLGLHKRNQMGFRKERPARSYGKTGASWFCEAWRCPRALVKRWNSLNHFYFLKREGGQAPETA